MLIYYMFAVFFVIMTNIAVGFLSTFEEILNIPFFLVHPADCRNHCD